MKFHYNVLCQSVFKMLPKFLKCRKFQRHYDVTRDVDVSHVTSVTQAIVFLKCINIGCKWLRILRWM